MLMRAMDMCVLPSPQMPGLAFGESAWLFTSRLVQTQHARFVAPRRACARTGRATNGSEIVLLGCESLDETGYRETYAGIRAHRRKLPLYRPYFMASTPSRRASRWPSARNLQHSHTATRARKLRLRHGTRYTDSSDTHARAGCRAICSAGQAMQAAGDVEQVMQ